MDALGTEESGHCGKVAIVERLKRVSRRLKILEWISRYEIFPG